MLRRFAYVETASVVFGCWCLQVSATRPRFDKRAVAVQNRRSKSRGSAGKIRIAKVPDVASAIMILEAVTGKVRTPEPFEAVGFAMGPGWSWLESERQSKVEVSSHACLG